MIALPIAIAFDLAAGLVLHRVRSATFRIGAAWALVAANVAIAAAAAATLPPVARMISMIAAVLLAMKLVVIATADVALPPGRWLAFAVGWPGMRPENFRDRRSRPLPGAARLITRGVLHAVLGASALGLAWVIWSDFAARRIATPLLLLGPSLALHFGVFNLLAGLWRLAGFDCRPLFRAPLLASSIGEFWSKRWNLAFSEMTSAAVYRPLCRRVGRPVATAAAFLFSGVLHELAISFPVGAGYGMPTAYFALHGALVLFERRLARSGTPIDRYRWLGRIWAVGWLALPLPLLFHRAFLDGVVRPLIGMEVVR